MLVPVLARAAAVVGADGLLVEVHPTPDQALSDGVQSLNVQQFTAMMDDIARYVPISTTHLELQSDLLAMRGGA